MAKAAMKQPRRHFLFFSQWESIKSKKTHVNGSKKTFNILEITKNMLLAVEEAFDEVVAEVVEAHEVTYAADDA